LIDLKIFRGLVQGEKKPVTPGLGVNGRGEGMEGEQGWEDPPQDLGRGGCHGLDGFGGWGAKASTPPPRLQTIIGMRKVC